MTPSSPNSEALALPVSLPHLGNPSFTLPNGWKGSIDVFTRAVVLSFAREAVLADRAAIEADRSARAVPGDMVARDSDQQLMRFYSVETIPALIDAQERHIARLQAKLPPLRDEFTPTPRSA